MYQNFETIDRYQISRNLIVYISKIHEELTKPSNPKSELTAIAEPKYVVATYRATGLGTVDYESTLKTAEHFSDENEAMSYYLSLVDPEEFGPCELTREKFPHWIPEKSFKAPKPAK